MGTEDIEKIESVETEDDKKIETLETEIKKFADSLQYWAKYLAGKILQGNSIQESEVCTAYTYLLEELNLIPVTTRPQITINYSGSKPGYYKQDLIFTKLESVEGVNALTENQIIEFNSNVSIIYGANGSGKSGYVRLMKKVFYSKAPEEIIKNIYLTSGHKDVSAKFTFQSTDSKIELKYPNDAADAAFMQFSVFDGKSILQHLDHRNEFEFRPAGLSFFANFTEAINLVALKLNTEIENKQSINNFADLFDGESEIKTAVLNLSSLKNITELKKFLPYSDKDKADKKIVENKYDELFLATKGKEQEIKNLENIKQLLISSKLQIDNLNQYFTSDNLSLIQSTIRDYIKKEASAKGEGIENFKTEKIIGIGTSEWKNFIVAAEQFAMKQKTENIEYPDNGDNCIFCQQPLLEDAQKLIANYWTFIKSVAEQNAKQTLSDLDRVKESFEKLNFDLFLPENSLTIWLSEKYPKVLSSLKQCLSNQKTLADNVIADISAKATNSRTELKINLTEYENIVLGIDASIKQLRDDELNIEMDKLLKVKSKFAHKEKLEMHIAKIEIFVLNQQWIKNANNISWQTLKTTTTTTEKRLSGKYFNQKYIDTFNKECDELKGNFGISINSRSSEAKSNRQLLVKGNFPSIILSEGEQKIIAIADFLAEMQCSEVNRGIIFDDPVTSLDDNRKSEIANRLVKESKSKQVILFTHDLAFVSSIVSSCDELKVNFDCHWIEKLDNNPGTVWLRNTPSFEKNYKKSGKAQDYYKEAKNLGPESREDKLKNGFAALRTSYESLIVFDLFKGVVQRFKERVSVDSLTNVYFTTEIRDELIDSFYQCCRYMEGHLHSDKYAYKKPMLENLNDEITRFDAIKKKISDLNKNNCE